jgi:hypothetical protein
MSEPRDIDAATKRIIKAKEIKRAEMMLELALEKLVELDGMGPTRRRLLVITRNLKWY